MSLLLLDGVAAVVVSTSVVVNETEGSESVDDKSASLFATGAPPVVVVNEIEGSESCSADLTDVRCGSLFTGEAGKDVDAMVVSSTIL